MRTIVIGGGIAGLAAARALAERGREVTLLEAEPLLATHSSARNAQIWLPVDDDGTTGPLARRSAEQLDAWLGDAWLSRTGAVVLGSEGQRDAFVRGAAAGGLSARPITMDEARAQSPAIGGEAPMALRVEGAGVMDTHAMITALERAGRDAGVRFRTNARVREVEPGRAVRLHDGESIACGEVLVAAGAWARALGRSAGADTPLVPLRRHLAVIDAPPSDARTIVWRFDEPAVYWRPESGGVLVSPCDEEVFDPCLPEAAEALPERLVAALEPTAPSLLDAPVRTAWACLRTYAHDRELVLGPDPRVDGLAWLAGLGGRGMTVGVAAGEWCAAAMHGEEVPAGVRPDRPQPSGLIEP